MTPILIDRSSIAPAFWDDHISRSRQCVFYAYAFYLDLVCEDWKALVWPSADEFSIVMPLPVRRKLGKKIVYQPHFCQYLGLFSRSEITSEQAEAFLRALSAHFSYISAYHFNPDNFDPLIQKLNSLDGIEYVLQKTHWLDLGKDYDQIRESYSGDRKLNLQRSQKADWQLMKSKNIHPLIYLFVSNHEARIPGGVSPEAYDRLESIFEKLRVLKMAELWYAHKEGVIHAGIFIIRSAGRAVYLFNASDSVGRKGNARTFLLDQYFKENAGQQLIFDFESPEIAGIADFYQSFGSTAAPYIRIYKNGLGFPWKQLQKLRKWFFLKTN